MQKILYVVILCLLINFCHGGQRIKQLSGENIIFVYNVICNIELNITLDKVLIEAGNKALF